LPSPAFALFVSLRETVLYKPPRTAPAKPEPTPLIAHRRIPAATTHRKFAPRARPPLFHRSTSAPTPSLRGSAFRGSPGPLRRVAGGADDHLVSVNGVNTSAHDPRPRVRIRASADYTDDSNPAPAPAPPKLGGHRNRVSEITPGHELTPSVGTGPRTSPSRRSRRAEWDARAPCRKCSPAPPIE